MPSSAVGCKREAARAVGMVHARDGDAAARETRAQQRVLLTGAYTSIRD